MWIRFLDMLLSIICLVVLSPVFVVIALLIKLGDKGPIFYLCDRVGKNMNIFKMYKFRTMIDRPFEIGDNLSPKNDPRVTSFGRFLRRSKLNELPQFINVLRGEMTFVGPRPEAPDLVEQYPDRAKKIFSIKPGLIGPNDVTIFSGSICGRNEEDLYPSGVDVEKYYLNEILPKKVEVDLEYMQHQSLLLDLKYILLGAKEILVGAVNSDHIQENRAQLWLVFADIVISIISYSLTYILLDFLHRPVLQNLLVSSLFLFAVIAIRVCWNAYYGLYKVLIGFFSFRDFCQILKAVLLGSLTLLFFNYLFGLKIYFKEWFVIDSVFLIILLSVIRLSLRLYRMKGNRERKSKDRIRVLIFGASETGYLVCRTLGSVSESKYRVVGFIDDDSQKLRKTLNGLDILGNRHDIKVVAKLLEVDELIISIPKAYLNDVHEITKICQEAGLRYRFFDLERESELIQHFYSSQHKTSDFSRILRLPEMKMDYTGVKQILHDKTVLVNGSGGRLGLELCQQILRLGCRQLIILDRYESYLTELVRTLYNDFSEDVIKAIAFDGHSIDTLEKVFMDYRPNIVFHTCMKKYIPYYELEFDNIGPVNYLQPFQLARTSVKYGCEFFTMISSWAASTGDTFIGESLRIAELSLKCFLESTNTRLIITRVCDVAESRGGIVYEIEKQVLEKGRVNTPSFQNKVFLLSSHSAVQFILQSLVESRRRDPGEDVFICDVGLPVTVIEIAKKIANFHGVKLHFDTSIEDTKSGNEYAEAVQERMENLTPTSHRHVKVLKNDGTIDSDMIKTVLIKFVSSGNGQHAPEDWRRRTQELLSLCGPGIFMGREEGESIGGTASFKSR